VEFAIGAKRIAPRWRLLDGVAETDWVDAIDMHGAQVAVATYCPDRWPATTGLLIRRVRLDIDPGAVSPDPRARRRRTLHPQQRVLPLPELGGLDAVHGYSFIITSMCPHRTRPRRWSTGTGTAPRWRTSSATPSTVPRSGT